MASEKETIVLHTNHDSSPTWRVRIALAFKGLQFERKFYKYEELGSPEISKVNPLGQIPALEIDGEIFTQSLAIIDYLDAKYPHPQLLPRELKKRAKAMEIVEIINTAIQPQCNIYYYHFEDGGKEYARRSKDTVEKGFAALEKILNQTAGKFCIGDDFTMADVCLVPQVHRAIGYNVDLAVYPKINEIWKRLLNVDAVRNTRPDNELDCPKPKAF